LILSPSGRVTVSSDLFVETSIKKSSGAADLGIGTTSNVGINVFTNDTGRMYITNGGNVGIATTSPTAKLDVNSDILRLRTAKTPASASATGNQGDFAWDADYLYICVAANTWRRVAHSSW
jgi:hypothetical protein